MALLESDFTFIDIPIFNWELTGRDESEFIFTGNIDPPPAPPPTPSPPVISNILPTPASSIYAATALQFDATDPDGMVLISAYVTYPDGSTEQMYDGTVFTAKYSSSAISPIANGSHFNLVRTGGWPASPTLSALAVDVLGARSVPATYSWTLLPTPTNPEVIQAVSPKYTQVRVTYSRPMVMTAAANGALRVANYAIPGLTIFAAERLNAQQVLLSTSAQTADLVYYLTITGVQDLEGNTIL